MFNQELKFELHLVKLDCNADWVEETVIAAKDLLESNIYPNGSRDCDTCQYLKKRWHIKNS